MYEIFNRKIDINSSQAYILHILGRHPSWSVVSADIAKSCSCWLWQICVEDAFILVLSWISWGFCKRVLVPYISRIYNSTYKWLSVFVINMNNVKLNLVKCFSFWVLVVINIESIPLLSTSHFLLKVGVPNHSKTISNFHILLGCNDIIAH